MGRHAQQKFAQSCLQEAREISAIHSISLNFYQTNLLSSPQLRYMFDINKLFLIDVLKVIPGETRDDLLRIAIDLPESQQDFR